MQSFPIEMRTQHKRQSRKIYFLPLMKTQWLNAPRKLSEQIRGCTTIELYSQALICGLNYTKWNNQQCVLDIVVLLGGCVRVVNVCPGNQSREAEQGTRAWAHSVEETLTLL